MKRRWLTAMIVAAVLAAAAGGATWWWLYQRPEPAAVLPFGGGTWERLDGRSRIRDLVLDHLPTAAEWQMLADVCGRHETAVAGEIRLPEGLTIPIEAGTVRAERNGDMVVVLSGKMGKMTAIWDPRSKILDLDCTLDLNNDQSVVFPWGDPLKISDGRVQLKMTTGMTDDPAAGFLHAAISGDAGAVIGGRRIRLKWAEHQNGRWDMLGETVWSGAAIQGLQIAGSGGAYSWRGLLGLPGASPLAVRGKITAAGWDMASIEPSDWQLQAAHGRLWLGNVTAAGQGDAVILNGELRALAGDDELTASAGQIRLEWQNNRWSWKLQTPRLQIVRDGRLCRFSDVELSRQNGRFSLKAKQAEWYDGTASVILTGAVVGGRWDDQGIRPEGWAGAIRFHAGTVTFSAAEWRDSGNGGTFRQGQLENGRMTWRAASGSWRRDGDGMTVDCPSLEVVGGRLTAARLTAVQLGFAAVGDGAPRSLKADAIDGKYDGAGDFSLRQAVWAPDKMTVASGEITVDGTVWQLSGSIPGKFIGKTTPGRMTDAFEAETELSPDGVIAFKGRSQGAFFADGGFFFRGTARRHDPLATLQAAVELPAARIDRPVAAVNFGLPEPWLLAGRCSASGDFALERRPHLRADWKLDGTLSSGDFVLTGVDAAWKTDGGVLRFAALNAPDFAAANGTMVLEKNGHDGAFRTQSLTFECAGGFWRYESSADDRTRFAVEGVAAGKLHPALAGAVTVPLSGTVELEIGDAIVLHAARLTAAQSGSLKLGMLENLRYLPEKGVNPEVFECAAALGKDFVFKRLNIRLRQYSADRLLLHIDAEGHPAAAIPFVPTETGFRRTRGGETGFFGNCELGSDYLLPVRSR